MINTIQTTPLARPTPLRTLNTIAITALLGYGGLTMYAMTIMAGRPDWRGSALIVATMLLTGLIASGQRWALPLAALLSALMLLEMLPTWRYALAQGSSGRALVFHSLFVAAGIVGLAAGVGATAQQYRALRWMGYGMPLAALAVVAVLAAIAITLLPRPEATGPTQAGTMVATTLTTANFAFDRAELRARAGETVELRLLNRDPFAHSFDLDAWQVHQLMLTGEASVIRFTPTEPGAYTFYCGIPGHRQSGMTGTVVVEP